MRALRRLRHEIEVRHPDVSRDPGRTLLPRAAGSYARMSYRSTGQWRSEDGRRSSEGAGADGLPLHEREARPGVGGHELVRPAARLRVRGGSEGARLDPEDARESGERVGPNADGRPRAPRQFVSFSMTFGNASANFSHCSVGIVNDV